MKNFIIATTLALSTCAAAPVTAQNNIYAPKEIFVEKLNNDYGETIVFRSILPNGNIMEIYSNPSTGSMTVIMTDMEGISCYMTHGVESRTFNNDMET